MYLRHSFGVGSEGPDLRVWVYWSHPALPPKVFHFALCLKFSTSRHHRKRDSENLFLVRCCCCPPSLGVLTHVGPRSTLSWLSWCFEPPPRNSVSLGFIHWVSVYRNTMDLCFQRTRTPLSGVTFCGPEFLHGFGEVRMLYICFNGEWP